MSLKCKLGLHSWDGCKCSDCDLIRDEQHDWKGCKCAGCGKERYKNHNWSDDGEKCIECGIIMDTFLSSIKFPEGFYLQNELTSIKKNRYLNLRKTKLNDYSFLENFNMLKTLLLSSNDLTDVSFLRELKELERLDLGFNKLTDLSFLKELARLQDLNIGGNQQIKDFSFLRELNELKILDLSCFPQIYSFYFLIGLNGLKEFSLYNSKETDFSFLRYLKGLTSLDLGGNEQIEDYSFLKEVKGLKKLSLSLNFIKNKDISYLEELKDLEELELNHNLLTDVSIIKELKSLKNLDLRNNHLTDVSFLKGLKELVRLDLRNNDIDEIPEWFHNSRLEIISSDEFYDKPEGIAISGNPMSHKYERERSKTIVKERSNDQEIDIVEVNVEINKFDKNTNAVLQVIYLFMVENAKQEKHISPILYEEIADMLKVDIDSYDGEKILLGTLRILAEIDIKAGRPILALNAVGKTNRPDFNLIEHFTSGH